MKILIRQVKITDPSSPHNGQTADVLIEDSLIKEISPSSGGKVSERSRSAADHEIAGDGCCLSPGFFDLHVNFREPGFEYKEDLASGCRAATAGGFTGVLLMPSTRPVIQSSGELRSVKNKTWEELVDVEAAAALSEGLYGKELSEMYDLHQGGARAFTDDKHAVQDTGLMLRALLYAKNFGGLVMSFASDTFLSGKGQVNEGITATRLGLKGIPSLAEEMMIARDLMLCAYAETGVHFSTISTRGSVDLIREAKGKGIKVTCDVAAHHLLLDDTRLEDFDTRFKITPPLRTKEDIDALKAGLADGTIDAICSDHSPEDTENKVKEFDLAEPGAEGLETCFAAALTALKGVLTMEQLIEKLAIAPRRILALPLPVIAPGQTANLTLFNPGEEWQVEEKGILSKSKNNPFIGMKLTGKVKAVFNKGKFLLT